MGDALARQREQFEMQVAVLEIRLASLERLLASSLLPSRPPPARPRVTDKASNRPRLRDRPRRHAAHHPWRAAPEPRRTHTEATS